MVVRLEDMVHGQRREAPAAGARSQVVPFTTRTKPAAPPSPADPFPLDATGTDGGF